MLPPLIGVAVNVRDSPGQKFVSPETAMVTDGVTMGLTVTTMAFDKAGAVWLQPQVTSQVTDWPVVKVEEVKTDALLPALTPLIFH